MPSIYFGFRNFLGNPLGSAKALVQPLASMRVGNVLRLPDRISVDDGQTVSLPTGDYRVSLVSTSLTVKGWFSVGSINTDFAQLFVEDNGSSKTLPQGTPITNIIGLQRVLDGKVSTDDPRLNGSGGSGGSFTEIIEVLTPSQTTWVLQQTPTNPGKSRFFVNGQKQRYAVDYQINGPVLTWQGYALKSDWTIEVYYY